MARPPPPHYGPHLRLGRLRRLPPAPELREVLSALPPDVQRVDVDGERASWRRCWTTCGASPCSARQGWSSSARPTPSSPASRELEDTAAHPPAAPPSCCAALLPQPADFKDHRESRAGPGLQPAAGPEAVGHAAREGRAQGLHRARRGGAAGGVDRAGPRAARHRTGEAGDRGRRADRRRRRARGGLVPARAGDVGDDQRAGRGPAERGAAALAATAPGGPVGRVPAVTWLGMFSQDRRHVLASKAGEGRAPGSWAGIQEAWVVVRTCERLARRLGRAMDLLAGRTSTKVGRGRRRVERRRSIMRMRGSRLAPQHQVLRRPRLNGMSAYYVHDGAAGGAREPLIAVARSCLGGPCGADGVRGRAVDGGVDATRGDRTRPGPASRRFGRHQHDCPPPATAARPGRAVHVRSLPAARSEAGRAAVGSARLRPDLRDATTRTPRPLLEQGATYFVSERRRAGRLRRPRGSASSPASRTCRLGLDKQFGLGHAAQRRGGGPPPAAPGATRAYSRPSG